MSTWVDDKDQDIVARWLAANGTKACEEYRTTDPRFALWMYCVDRQVKRRVHFGCFDLEDWGYFDAYEDGMSPADAAREVIEYNGVLT